MSAGTSPQTPAATQTPSTRRPIPLHARNDLVLQQIFCQGGSYWVIKDPVALRYYRLQPEQYYLWRLLDGQRSLEDIRSDFHHEFPYTRPTLADIQSVLVDLHRKGLVYSHRAGQGQALLQLAREQRSERIRNAFKSFLYLRTPGWDPERVLQRLEPWIAWMFHPLAVLLAVLLVAGSWVLLGVQFQEFRNRLPEFQQFFGWPNLMYLWVILAGAKIIHEFGHGLTCRHFGSECHQMGVMLLVFSPALYCDVTDSWMLRSKWQRIMIGAGGMYIEAILAAVALYVWWFTHPGLLHHLCLNLFFVSAVTTVIFNANPLMRFDGYYMLSDFLEIPNLRPKADRMLREAFAWNCLGIELPADPFMPQHNRIGFVIYAVAASLYGWIVMYGITLFLYAALKPYGLQSLGISLAIASTAMILISMGSNLVNILRTPRAEPLDRRKLALTLSLGLATVAGLLLLPLPWHVEAVFFIEPHQVQHVYTSVPGQLLEMRVQPGDVVEEGQVLALLADFERDRAYRLLERDRDVQEIDLRVHRALDDPSQEALTLRKLENIEAQLAEYQSQLDQLTIRAPLTGMVVAPPPIPAPKLNHAHIELTSWYGSPLELPNLGCTLDERTHLLSLAPNSRFQAVLIVDQADRADLEVGQAVDIKFDHLPHQNYRGVIETISQGQVEFVPRLLSNKYGGDLATVTDSQGRERLSSIAYQATVLLDESTYLLKDGLRGRTRFYVGHRSAGQWIWRWIRRTFHFRL